MKICYCLRSLAHWTYHESIVRPLCAAGHSVTVLFDRRWSSKEPGDAAYQCAAQYPALRIDWSLRRDDAWRPWLFPSREIRSYANYLRRDGQAEFYTQRWLGYLPRAVRWVAGFALGRRAIASGWAESMYRAIEDRAPADARIVAWLREERPDVVVVSPSNLRFAEETEYLKAAKALGIPTALPVLSWDNLSTKGLIHLPPDALLAWNGMHAEEAEAIHDIPRDRIVVTGAPFLDKWFSARSEEEDGRELARQTEIDLSRPFVLYLGSSANIASDESGLVRGLAKALRESDDPRLRGMTVLARPHGANQGPFKNMDEPNVQVWLRDQLLPDTEEGLAAFSAAIRRAVAVIGLNTTGMVDAVLADRPVIALLPEEYRQANASQAVHFKLLLDAEIYERAATPQECVPLIRALETSDPRREARRRFALKYVRPQGLDRSAGEICARAIELLAEGKTAAQIRAALASSETASAPFADLHKPA